MSRRPTRADLAQTVESLREREAALSLALAALCDGVAPDADITVPGDDPGVTFRVRLFDAHRLDGGVVVVTRRTGARISHAARPALAWLSSMEQRGAEPIVQRAVPRVRAAINHRCGGSRRTAERS